MKSALLNTSIITSVGTFEIHDISLQEAKEIINKNEFQSYIGHESTAQILTSLLEKEVSMDRTTFEQQTWQQALVFKLNGRAPEGVILSIAEIEAMGYKFQLLTKISD